MFLFKSVSPNLKFYFDEELKNVSCPFFDLVLRRRRRCPGDAKLEAVVQAVDLARGVTSEPF